MSGSRKWMTYEGDNGLPYSVEIDESNGELAGFLDIGDGVPPNLLPSRSKMRYANVIEPVTGATRRIWVGSTTSDIWTGVVSGVLLFLEGIATPGNVLWLITSLVGEKGSRPVGRDTRLIDGDIT